MDKPFHVSIRNRHRFTPSPAQPAVLEGTYLFYDRVKGYPSFMYEKQIRHKRNFLADTHSTVCHQAPLHRNEDFHLHSFEQLIGRFFCVRPFQVAHHVPPYVFLVPQKCRHFVLGQFYQSCKIVYQFINQAVINV